MATIPASFFIHSDPGRTIFNFRASKSIVQHFFMNFWNLDPRILTLKLSVGYTRRNRSSEKIGAVKKQNEMVCFLSLSCSLFFSLSSVCLPSKNCFVTLG